MIPTKIELRGISKTFGESQALAPLHLDIAPGEFVSVIGPSGCGKSTTLLIASGLEKPTSGQVVINGSSLDRPQTDIGIVFQEHLLLDHRTALDNVMLQAQVRHMDEAAGRHRARELLGKLGLAESTFDRYPHQLSGGTRQRVSIARALFHEPSVLMMDEPFGALDALSRTQIRHDLEMLWLETGKTVLFITHSIEEAIGLSDRIVIMSPSPGRIVDEIHVSLPRPRPAFLGEYPEFAKYAARINATFRSIGAIRY